MESKYGQVYPERAVAPLRALVEGLLLSIVGSMYADTTQVHLKDLRAALNASEDNSFPQDEPLFLLRGQDDLAPDTVLRYLRLVDEESGAFSEDREGTIIRLYELVALMRAWEPRKLPD